MACAGGSMRLCDVGKPGGETRSESGGEAGGRGVFLGLSALLFAVSAAATVRMCASMAAMPMPGGGAMSAVWMPMCGQTWFMATASFVGMWSVMMVPMMLPACAPMLWRYREALHRAGEVRLALPTLLAGAGYGFVWLLAGCAMFALGAMLAAVEMRVSAFARIVPMAAGGVVVIAGAWQFSGWKAHRLACCRLAPDGGGAASARAAAAWRHGVTLGLRCGACCGNLMLMLLVFDMMDLRAMALVTVAIAAERAWPIRGCVPRAIGVVGVALGVAMVVRAIGA
jgi:predicted metal-binding membrane protein